MKARGEMPEWPNGIDSKSIVAAMPPRVRIPVSPPFISFKPAPVAGLAFLPCQPLPQFGYSQCLSGEDSLLGGREGQGTWVNSPILGPLPLANATDVQILMSPCTAMAVYGRRTSLAREYASQVSGDSEGRDVAETRTQSSSCTPSSTTLLAGIWKKSVARRALRFIQMNNFSRQRAIPGMSVLMRYS